MDTTTTLPRNKITAPFQFGLSDALLILVTCAVAELGLNRLGHSKPTVHVAAAVATLLGAFTGIVISRNNLTKRVPAMLSAIIFSWAFASLFIHVTKSRMAATDLFVVAACKTFSEAEEIYHRTDYTGNGVLKYAPTLKVLNGTHDELMLVGKHIADAEFNRSSTQPLMGFYFKVLTAQGSHAQGGRKSYIDADGNMTGGYALVALPTNYDPVNMSAYSIKTYMINNSGTILEKDLGPDGFEIVEKMTEFDPDETWVPTQ